MNQKGNEVDDARFFARLRERSPSSLMLYFSDAHYQVSLKPDTLDSLASTLLG